jgi:putative FmdB family regulatory protein|tara:strand:- start:207 stop:470 length:264 start_codon:yes stop_codon:yes gene_type:complete
MPTYKYECEGCQLVFEEFHLMSETVESCKECGAPVKKLLSNSFNIKKNLMKKKNQAGNVVKQYIKDTREELKREKNRIKTEEYEVKR